MHVNRSTPSGLQAGGHREYEDAIRNCVVTVSIVHLIVHLSETYSNNIRFSEKPLPTTTLP